MVELTPFLDTFFPLPANYPLASYPRRATLQDVFVEFKGVNGLTEVEIQQRFVRNLCSEPPGFVLITSADQRSQRQ